MPTRSGASARTEHSARNLTDAVVYLDCNDSDKVRGPSRMRPYLDLGAVSGIGEVPDNVAALSGGPPMINYGAQNSGPHIAPPQNLVKDFITACDDDGTFLLHAGLAAGMFV